MKEWTNGISTLYHADAREIPLPDKSVHMCVTSPPYWGLRDYGLGEWEGGDAECGHKRLESVADQQYQVTHPTPGGWRQNKGEMPPIGTCHCGAVQQAAGIGLEPTLGEWVDNVVEVMREARRVLRDDGTVWLNLGDSYSAGGRKTSKLDDLDGTIRVRNGNHQRPTYPMGLDAKNLIGQPWRVAFALQDDGWILRSAPVWHKPNPMPESCTDRPTSSYEMVFMLTKQGKYFYDAEAVRTEHKSGKLEIPGNRNIAPEKTDRGHLEDRLWGVESGANVRNVWTIPTQGRPDAHFATFPDELPRRCILAGTSEHGVCGDCGAPWARVVDKTESPNDAETASAYAKGSNANRISLVRQAARKRGKEYQQVVETLGWQPTCTCDAAVVPATVLDPFVGSGTTCAVAQSLGRRSIGLDLNHEYLGIAAKRIGAVTLPLGLLR